MNHHAHIDLIEVAMSPSINPSTVVTVSELPYKLLMQHRATIRSMLLGGMKSLLPFKKSASAGVPLLRHSQSPSNELLSYYRQWCNAPSNREVPPHFVGAAVAMPIVAELTAQAPYPLLSVLNQGVRLQMHKALPAGETIMLSGKLLGASDDGRRARIHSQVHIGTASAPNAITLDAIAAVMLRAGPKSARKSTVEKRRFETLGTWRGAANEGQTFFWLTGDFNPIHTLPAFAKYTRYKGCIMHGYGAFAHIFERLKEQFGTLKEIETRFIRTIPLPSPQLSIQCTMEPDEDGLYYFRMLDELNITYQAGQFHL
jgi:hypothetical protein